jgi:hypothetical protein
MPDGSPNKFDIGSWLKIGTSLFYKNDLLSPLLAPLLEDLQDIMDWKMPSQRFIDENNKENPYKDLKEFLSDGKLLESRRYSFALQEAMLQMFDYFIPAISKPELYSNDIYDIKNPKDIKNLSDLQSMVWNMEVINIIFIILETLKSWFNSYSHWSNFSETYHPLRINEMMSRCLKRKDVVSHILYWSNQQ